ncbi:MAG: adenylate/guanylate cyclase domain-containing response regulator [Treponema sp.]|jgi:class 3 adenylate cyclase/DNA-binding response OmpR family regulator|nr:adenylate/guanylate cyclase domain-containing response regulator [Treponema sp.]
MDDSVKRILLLEDSDIFADVVMEFLSEAGYEVKRAVNGFEGIKQVYTFLPHLIVTDIEMPVLKGYQATRLLKSRKSTKAIPVIMFTSLEETKDKFWGAQAGADLYLEKSPGNLKELKNGIEELLGKIEGFDFSAVEREGKRIDDNALIEMVNNLLDNKLFQTTVTGMLAELSEKLSSLEEVVRGIFGLLNYICEAEIVSIMITGSENTLHVYSANFAGFTQDTAGDFTGISAADFAGIFPDFQVVTRNTKDFYPFGDRKKTIESYIIVPLSSSGRKFASVHIANSIKEYFTPAIVENLNLFLAAAAPVISNALLLLEMDKLQKKTRAAFARYVPADVMDEIIHKSTGTREQSETRQVVVLFSDIRQFTKISEKNGAQEIVAFLNSFFSAMGNEILSEGGYIDKFIGDAIMAVFGVSGNLPDAPIKSIRAAVKMLAAASRADTSAINLPESGLHIGVGINCGECVVGNIGFQDKMDYTLIGNTVNMASRLEGITKQYHHPLIVSEFMYELAKDAFIFRKIDVVRAKGKDEPVGIYAVYTGFAGEVTKNFRDGRAINLPEVPALLINREVLNNFNNGLKLYNMREWETAREYFRKALIIDGDDYFSSLYLGRCIDFLREPPPEDWDGAVTLTEK